MKKMITIIAVASAAIATAGYMNEKKQKLEGWYQGNTVYGAPSYLYFKDGSVRMMDGKFIVQDEGEYDRNGDDITIRMNKKYHAKKENKSVILDIDPDMSIQYDKIA